MKKVKFVNSNFQYEITERITIYNDKKVWNIDTSVLRRDSLVILNDENNKRISEIFIPRDMLVIVDYID